MKRLFAPIIIVVLVLGFVSVMSAQDGSGCYNLAISDCEIVNSAYENADNITSFYQKWSFDFEASGLGVLAMLAGGGVPDTIVFSNTGEGPFVIDPSADFPIALYSDQTASLTSGEDVQDFGAYAFAVVNGHLYLPDGSGGHVGLPLEVVLDPEMLGLEDQLGSLGLPAEGLNMNLDDLEMNNFGDLLGDDTGMGEMDTFLAEYSDYARLSDEEMMGQTMYPFVYTLDLGRLLNSDEFTGLMALAGGMGGDDPDVAAAMEFVPMLLGGLESTVEIQQWVGADDGYVHRFGVDMDASLDISALMGGQAGSMEPIELVLSFVVDIDQQNETFDVSTPPNAQELSVEEAREMLGDGS